MIQRLANLWRRWVSGETPMRPDYRAFDMRQMKHWGFNAFWWPEYHDRPGRRVRGVCIFASPGPRPGDVLIDQAGRVHVIQEKDFENPDNPGDQYLVDVVETNITELPPTERQPSISDDFV